MAPFLLLSLWINRLSAAGAVSAAREHTGITSSPNAWIPLSLVAGGLGVRLEKPGHYILCGSRRLPSPGDIARALKVVDVALLLYSGAVLIFVAVV